MTGFNPRPCARGDACSMPGYSMRKVSIHAPARGATGRPLQRRVLNPCFNPRPCARGDIPVITFEHHGDCFNPRPCARGDKSTQYGLSGSRVSIHAPARGATSISPWFISSRDVSIHAPARGATQGLPMIFRECTFQSTPLREGRPPLCGQIRLRSLRFNPRPCARGDDYD